MEVNGEDKRILDGIRERVHHYPELLLVRFEVQQGVVVIRGSVTTFYVKQIAQEAIRPVPGITQVQNQIDVKTN